MSLFIKGMIIGLGKILPGVSGGMLAIQLGLYDKILYSINNIKKSNIIFLLKIFIGIFVSIILFSNIIINLLDKYYICTMSLFIGLLFGGIKEIKNNIIKKNKYIIILVFSIVILLGFINSNNNVNINNTFLNIIYYFFGGILEAISTIIPGISGTATLMIYGIYDKVMFIVSNIYLIDVLKDNIIIIISFILGLIIGLFLTIKFINIMLKKYNSLSYNIILGFYYSSIFILIINTLKSKYNIINLFISIILFMIGVFISKKINQLND